MPQKINKYVSGNLDFLSSGKPVGLLLHGYGSNEEDLPGLMRYLPLDLAWYSLRAPVELGNGYFAWANRVTPGHPPVPDVELATEAIWNWVDRELDSESKLIVFGFSQGGLMATQLLRTRPSRITSTVILAGFTLEASQPADEELRAKRPKVIYARGLQDEVISQEAVLRTLTWLKAHTRAEIRSYEGLGHSIDERVMADVGEYLVRELS